MLSLAALERLGGLVRSIAAATPDGDLRRAALALFLRDRMPVPFHRDVPAALMSSARALLASLELPGVLMSTARPAGPRTLPLPHAVQRRDVFWEHVVMEARRNPALAIAGAPQAAVPDLVIVDGESCSVDDPAVTAAARGSELDQRRAHHVVGQIETRRAELTAIGAVVASVQHDFLHGAALCPTRLPCGVIVARLEAAGLVMYPHRVSAYVGVARLACGDRTYALAELVVTPSGDPRVRAIRA